MAPIVIYTGPSMLDGNPIVVLASLGSKNEKTGPMIQTWIVRADMSPVEARSVEADRTVCGDCPRRHALGGDCYVLIHNAPQSAWSAWWRHGSPEGDVTAAALAIASDADRYGIRMGAYGDPAAVPWQVWERLFVEVAHVTGRRPNHTGYSHQWARAMAPLQSEWCRRNLMASVDSPTEASLARASGWRYFLAMSPGSGDVPPRTIECLSVREASSVTCQECGICDGSQGRPLRVSVCLLEHGARSGAKAKRSAALSVVQ